MLAYHTYPGKEAGCDEAGRGCLAGPVFAAAVLLPEKFSLPGLDDSKKISEAKRNDLRKLIEQQALCWKVASINNDSIDEINILQASVKAMQIALGDTTSIAKQFLIDGNYFIPFNETPFHCIIKGDQKYASVAAASILAKTYRDDYMRMIHKEFPQYNWKANKGYLTKTHLAAIGKYGLSPYHRKSFHIKNQLSIHF